MTDNFDQIRKMLEFRSEDDFYFLQILQRKKDHKQGKVNGANNNARLIKAYYIRSLEYFDFIKPEVIELSKLFNARAGINLNRRSFEKMALQHLKKVTDQIINGDSQKAYKAYSSVVGAYNHDSDKKWIVDLDNGDDTWEDNIIKAINEAKPGGDKVIAIIPSKSGKHIITKPFDLIGYNKALNLELMEKYQISLNIDIHKNNPTNLYIP